MLHCRPVAGGRQTAGWRAGTG